MTLKFALPLIAPLVALAVPAQAQDWSGFYAGASLGYADVTGSTVLGDDVTGTTYGVFGGYRADLGSLVVGGELEYSLADITDDTIGLDAESVARAKVQVGYDAGAVLPYAVIGAAQLTTSGAVDDTDMGWLYGIGADYAISDTMTVGAELLQHEFDDYADTGIDVSATTVSARVSFKF